MNSVTMIEATAVVRRARPIAPGRKLSELFGTIEQQALTVVRLAGAAEDVLQGRESAHSLRLFELDQRREELWYRSRSAIASFADQWRGLEDVDGTMESLDRAAAGLFRSATVGHGGEPEAGGFLGRMLRHIRREGESLQEGYAGLARGWPSAQFDADDAQGSRNPLGSYRGLALLELLSPAAAGAPSAPAEQLPPMHGPHAGAGASWIAPMHAALSDVVRELAGAAELLLRLSQRLADGPLFQDQRREPGWVVHQASAAI
ncbi:MAG: hypothetical protein J5X21_05465 [Candidatus Accumulibacter sp.]|nr:hypothetical protein [Candidatus Accumulibacter conexus]